MAVGKGSIQRAAKAADAAAVKKPAVKKPAAKKAPVKKAAEQKKETKTIGIGTELPTYLL